MKKRLFAIITMIALVVSMLPVGALASETSSEEVTYTTVTVAENQDVIKLDDGNYIVNLYNVTARDSLTITGNGAGTKLAFSNLQVRACQFDTLTIENCTIERMPNKKWGHLVFGSSDNAKGIYTISNCVFNGASSQGIYINENTDGATYNIVNCVFNGDFGSEGAITIQNNADVDVNVNVTGCTFNNIPETSNEVFVHYNNAGLNLTVDGKVVVAKAAMLADTIAKANAGTTITLMSDVTLSEYIGINKDLTIDGANHKVTSTATRILRVTANDVDLALKNIEFVTSVAERGVQVDSNVTGVTLDIDNCVIPATAYAINICSGASVYMTIDDSIISGWGALNLWNAGYVVEVNNSVLNGHNNRPYNADGWNDFGVVVVEGDTTQATTMGATNNSVTLTDCEINATSETDNKQRAIVFNTNSVGNVVTLQGDKTAVTVVGDQFAKVNGADNTLAIKGGTFSTDPSNYVADGYIAVKSGDAYIVVLKEVINGAVEEILGAESSEDVTVVTPEIVVPDNTSEIEGDEESVQEVLDALTSQSAMVVTTAAAVEDAKAEAASVVQNFSDEEKAIIESRANVDLDNATLDVSEPIIQIVPVAVENGEIKLDISPVIVVTATQGGNSVEISVPVEIKETVVVTVPVPDKFVEAAEAKIPGVIHTKDNGRRYFYAATITNGVLCFSNPNGFSDFKLVADFTVADLLVENYDIAYGYAWDYMVANYGIDTLLGYLDDVANSIGDIATYVEGMEVPAQLAGTQAALIAELDLMGKNVVDLRNVLDSDVLDATEVAELFDSILAHADTIKVLGEALGVVGLEAWDQLFVASDFVADWADEVANEAYEWLMANDAEAKAAYDALVAEIVAKVAEISTELAAVVEEYLTETPAAAMKIAFAYGEDAVEAFIAAALEMSEDINDFITALSAIIELAEVEEMVEVMTSDVVRDALAIASAAKAQYDAVMAMYVVDALTYQVDLDVAKANLIDAQAALVAAIVNQMQEVVDPAVYAAAVEAWNALCDLAADAANVGGAYAEYVGENFALMSGDLLALIIENTQTYGLLAGEIIDEMIWNAINDAVDNVVEDAKDYIDSINVPNVDLAEIKAVITELETNAAEIRAQLNALQAYTGPETTKMVEELKTVLAEVESYAARLNALVVAIEDLVNEIENEPELTLDKVQAIVAQAQAIAADAQALVAAHESVVEDLVEVYETVMPEIIAFVESIDEDAPAYVVINTTGVEVEALVAEVVAGYEATLAALESATANIEPVVNEAVVSVCGSVAKAVESITVATEVAADEIYTAITTAIATIEEAAIEFTQSTDAEIVKAGYAILDMIAEFNAGYVGIEGDYVAQYEVVCGMVMDMIAVLETVDTVEEAEAVLAQAEDALEVLAGIALDLHEMAKDDVFDVLTNAEALAWDVVEIAVSAADNIGSYAVSAYTTSAEAVCTAVDTSVNAVCTAISAYDMAISTAAGEIIPVVTEAAEKIGAEVAYVANVTVGAAELIVAQAEGGVEAILTACGVAFYDATHGEFTSDCTSYYVSVGGDYAAELAEKLGLTAEQYVELAVAGLTTADLAAMLDETVLAGADLVTVNVADCDYTSFIEAQIAGRIAKLIKDCDDLMAVLESEGGKTYVVPVLAEYVDMTAEMVDIDWSVYLNAEQQELLGAVVEEIVATMVVNGLPEIVTIDVGSYVEAIFAEQFGFSSKVEIDLVVPVAEIVGEMVEWGAYAYVTHMYNYIETLNLVHELTDAEVVVVGQVIPMEEMVIAYEGVEIPVSEYVNEMLETVKLGGLVYAMLTPNTTYVEIPEGACVAECIYNALNVTVNGHNYEAVVTEATCTEAGYTTYTCTICGDEYVVEGEEAHGHNYVGVVTEPTYQAWGYTTYTCTVCGHEYVADYVKPLTPSTPVYPYIPAGHCAYCGKNVCHSAEFTDLNVDSWYHEYTDYILCRELMIGMGNKTFGPSVTTTRAMIVTILYRVAGSPVVSGDMPFTDVEEGKWYSDAILWAYQNGIVKGYGNDVFGTHDIVTREQMDTIFYRNAKLNGMDVSKSADISGYVDADKVSDWALDAVKWAVAVELMEGRSTTELAPTSGTTRAETATLFYRWCEEIL